MKIHVFYQRNEKQGEIKRPARWVVRQDSDEQTDTFFVLAPGQKGARAHAFTDAITWVKLQFGVSDLVQIKNGLWSNDTSEAPKARVRVSSKPVFVERELEPAGVFARVSGLFK